VKVSQSGTWRGELFQSQLGGGEIIGRVDSRIAILAQMKDGESGIHHILVNWLTDARIRAILTLPRAAWRAN
jgi:hypothetical protein